MVGCVCVSWQGVVGAARCASPCPPLAPPPPRPPCRAQRGVRAAGWRVLCQRHDDRAAAAAADHADLVRLLHNLPAVGAVRGLVSKRAIERSGGGSAMPLCTNTPPRPPPNPPFTLPPPPHPRPRAQDVRPPQPRLPTVPQSGQPSAATRAASARQQPLPAGLAARQRAGGPHYGAASVAATGAAPTRRSETGLGRARRGAAPSGSRTLVVTPLLEREEAGARVFAK